MSTLFEIVEAVKSNEAVDHDDLRYALLALAALHTFERSSVERMANRAESPALRKAELEESWRRSKTAFAAEPKTWLGPGNLPESEEYQQRRRAAFAILRKVERDLTREVR